jgi:hypothetical protein
VTAIPENDGTITWAEIKPIIERFCVWTDQPEIGWFQKAWKSLDAAGLTHYTNDVERHWVLVRGIALGIMYDDYCDLEWDEYSDPASCIGELFWDETISHVRIGAMAAGAVDPEDSDAHSVFVEAVLDLVGEVRLGVYDALVKGFGDSALLYAGPNASRLEGNDQENLASVAESLFDESGCLVDGRDEAFAYVNVGAMLAKDA